MHARVSTATYIALEAETRGSHDPGADYRIVIVTDFAGSSSQARVNRRTVEYLRSVTEIYLVEKPRCKLSSRVE